MTHPQFSIVITSYNQRDIILDAVRSALSQTCQSCEVIIVDDGSSDGSSQLLSQYEQAARVVLMEANQGAIAARNLGASLATGDYLVFLDGDDALMPWALDVYDRVIQARQPMLILARHRWVNGTIPSSSGCCDRPNKIDMITYDAPMCKDRPCGLSASTFVVRRSTFDEVGGWTPDIFQLDLQDLVTKLGYSGRLTLICEPETAFYRIHHGNTIHTVLPFIESLKRIIEKERSGQYPGGRAHRFERRAWLGGLAFFWIKRAVKAGLYGQAAWLAIVGCPMIIASVIRRAAAHLAGLRPVETIELNAR